MAKVLGIFDNPLPAPLDNNYGVFLLDLIIWIVAILIVYFAVELYIRHYAKRSKTELDDIVLAIIRVPLIIILVLFAFVNSLHALEEEWWTEPWMYDLVDKVYFIAIILVGLVVAYKVFKNVVIYYGKSWAKRTKTDMDDMILPVAEKIGVVIIALVGVAILLGYLGVDLTMLAVGSIVISMVVAFALQDTLSNFFAGMYLLTDRPFKVGDLVRLESGDICEVRNIGMRSTRLYKVFENSLLVVPNNKIAGEKVTCLVEPDLKCKTGVSVNVAYGSDVGKVKRLLDGIARAHPNVLKDKDREPVVRLTNFKDSAMEFTVFVWVDDVNNQWKVASDMREQMLEGFARERLEVPYPRMVVWQKDEARPPI